MNNATHSATPAGLPGPDRQAIKHLFRAGSGVQPPLLAGREPEMTTFAEILEDLHGEVKIEGEVVLFGPRGNGKTVLLRAFEEACSDTADVIALAASELKDETALARRLLRLGEATLKEADTLAFTGGTAGGKLVSGDWKKKNQAERDAYITTFLTDLLAERCAVRPLVVTLDEAHTLNEGVGRALLNVSQLARGQGAPFLLVLAGTPNLRDHLSAIQATFWSRAAKLGIGRLSEAATRQALVEPLAPHGVTFSADALVAVVDESQRYPYFIQVWGKALCNVLVEQGGQHIDADIVAAARPEFEAEHTDYYADRYNELEKQKLLPVAGAVTALFTQAPTWDRTALKNHLCAELSLKEDDALDAIRRLSHLGYVWEDYGKDRMEPGIPSLMSYVGERVDRALMPENQEPDPPAVSPARAA